VHESNHVNVDNEVMHVGGDVDVGVSLSRPFHIRCLNGGGGGDQGCSYEVCYGIGEIGTFEIAVTWRGRHIQNSPFRVKIENRKITPRPVVPHFGTGKLKGPMDVHCTIMIWKTKQKTQCFHVCFISLLSLNKK